jgi:hypothetical protein
MYMSNSETLSVTSRSHNDACFPQYSSFGSEPNRSFHPCISPLRLPARVLGTPSFVACVARTVGTRAALLSLLRIMHFHVLTISPRAVLSINFPLFRQRRCYRQRQGRAQRVSYYRSCRQGVRRRLAPYCLPSRHHYLESHRLERTRKMRTVASSFQHPSSRIYALWQVP